MEGRHCFAHLTIEENLLTGAYTRSMSRGDTAAALERVYQYFPRLKQRRASQAGYTSGGEQQMTAIGRALMANPNMILLDGSMGLAPQIRNTRGCDPMSEFSMSWKHERPSNERELMAAPARRHRPRDGALAGHSRAAARRRSRHDRFARGAGPAAGAAQARAAGTPAAQPRRRRARRAGQGLAASRPSAGARRCACSPRPARSMNRKARARLLALRPRAVRRLSRRRAG